MFRLICFEIVGRLISVSAIEEHWFSIKYRILDNTEFIVLARVHCPKRR